MNNRTLGTLNRELGFAIAIPLFLLTMSRYFDLTAVWSLVLLFLISIPIIFFTSKSLLEKDLPTRKNGEIFILISLILVYVFFFAFNFAFPKARFHFFEVLYQYKTPIFIALSLSILIHTFIVIYFVGCKKFTYIFPLLVVIVQFFAKFQFDIYSVLLLDLLLVFSFSCVEHRYKREKETIKLEKYPED